MNLNVGSGAIMAVNRLKNEGEAKTKKRTAPNPREKQKPKSGRRKSDGHPLCVSTWVLGQSSRKIDPNASQTGSKRQGQAKASSRHPLVWSAFLAGSPALCRGALWRDPRGFASQRVPLPVRRAPCICPSVVWLLCSSHGLLSTSTQHHKWLSNLCSAMAMFQIGRKPGCTLAVARSTIRRRRPEVLDLLAQAQALCDEARRAQLETELAQARTADELSAAIQDGKRVAAAACPCRKGGEGTPAPRGRCSDAPAEGSGGCGQEGSGGQSSQEGQAAQLHARVEGEAEAGVTEFKRRVACDRKAQRTAAKAEDSCAGSVTSVWCALGGLIVSNPTKRKNWRLACLLVGLGPSTIV